MGRDIGHGVRMGPTADITTKRRHTPEAKLVVVHFLVYIVSSKTQETVQIESEIDCVRWEKQ